MIKLKPFIFIILSMLLVACDRGTEDEDFLRDEVDIEVFDTVDKEDFKQLIIKDRKDSIKEGSLAFNLSTVYFSELGSYQVTVTYKDTSGNEGSKKIKVNVVDTTAPVIIATKTHWTVNLNSEKPDFLSVVSARDQHDGNITLTESNLDASTLDLTTEGEYYIQYTVKDDSGNEAVLNSYVKVVDPDSEYTINFVEDVVVGKNESNPDYYSLIKSAKDQADNDLDFLGYALEIDATKVDISTLGMYELSVMLFDSDHTKVKTVKTYIEVKPQATINFVKHMIASYSDPFFRPFDLIESVTDEYGEEVPLGREYKLKVNGIVDVNTLGEHPVTYQILDENDTVLSETSVTITVRIPYNINYVSSDLVAYYLDETFDEVSQVKDVFDMNGDKVELGTNYSIATNREVDVTRIGEQMITYELRDATETVIYSEDVMIEVSYFYDIIFKDSLAVNYDDKNFNLEDLFSRLVNAYGEEIDLSTGEFTVSTPRPVDLKTVGEQVITIHVIKHEDNTSTIVYKEDAIIHVVLN